MLTIFASAFTSRQGIVTAIGDEAVSVLWLDTGANEQLTIEDLGRYSMVPVCMV